MKSILGNKIYDTEKAGFVLGVKLQTGEQLNVYRTNSGRTFAESKQGGYLITEEVLKDCLRTPDCVDIYIEIFGEPEEA